MQAKNDLMNKMMEMMARGFEKIGISGPPVDNANTPSSSAASSPISVIDRSMRQPRRRNRSKASASNVKVAVPLYKVARRTVNCYFCEKDVCESDSPTQCALKLTWYKREDRHKKYSLCPSRTCLNSHVEKCSKMYSMKCTVCSGPHHLVYCKRFCDLSEEREYNRNGVTRFAEHADDYMDRQKKQNGQ